MEAGARTSDESSPKPRRRYSRASGEARQKSECAASSNARSGSGLPSQHSTPSSNGYAAFALRVGSQNARQPVYFRSALRKASSNPPEANPKRVVEGKSV